jgi:hypothetical protein
VVERDPEGLREAPDHGVGARDEGILGGPARRHPVPGILHQQHVGPQPQPQPPHRDVAPSNVCRISVKVHQNC